MPSPYRQLFTLAWPIVLARSAQSAIGFADAAMIAYLGKDALAATTTGAVNTFAMFIFPMGVVFIIQSFAAQLLGQSDVSGARRYAWYGLLIAAITQVLGIAAIPFVGTVLALTDFTPAVQALMTTYIQIRLLSAGAAVATEALGNWYGGLGDTRLMLLANILAMVVNIGLNWILIYGHLGFPALGVEGAAIASTVAVWVGFLAVAVVFARGYLPAAAGPKPPPGPLRLRLDELLRVLRFGLPSGFNWFLEFAAFIVFINVIFAGLGTLAVAAMMAVIQVNSVSFMPAFGLSSAGAILVGQAIGKGLHADVPAILRRTGIVCATWQGLVGLFYVAIPATIMATFAENDVDVSDLAALGTTLLAISAAWQLFDALAATLGEGLRAAGDTAWVMWARIGLAWVLWVPISLYVVRAREGGPAAATVCMVLYIAVLSLVLLLRFRSGAWRRIDLTGTAMPMH